jgi:hypothetical protein
MQHNKKAYFQGGGGVNEPTPKKKKYKSEKALLIQPRFEEPLYRNYDVYDVGGEHTPGTGAYHMDKHKSVKEFLKNKKTKDKYKAQDSWIEDTKSNRQERINKMKTRASLLSHFIKTAIDFPIDDNIQSSPILGDEGAYIDSAGIGGYLDEYLPLNDFEDKTPAQLDFGRDYVDEAIRNKAILNLINKYLNPKEPDLLGLLNGIDPEEDLDADKTVNRINPEYGITDSGNLIYQKMWI